MISKEDLKKFLLDNCVNEWGSLDLSNLDFSDFKGDVHIYGMKVKGNLWQNEQTVQGHLFQNFQKVQGSLLQDWQEVQGALWQHYQRVKGDLGQSKQTVQGNLHQNKQEVQGNLFQDNETGSYERGVEDTERKYFGGFKVGENIWIVDFCKWDGIFMTWDMAKATIWHFEVKANAKTTVVAKVGELQDPYIAHLERCFKTEEEAQAYLTWRIEEEDKLTLKNLISDKIADVKCRLRDASVSDLEDLLKSIQDEIERKGGKNG